MKKNIIALGLIVAATFALTNCTKEIGNSADGQESAGIPFELTASKVDTKTVNDGFNTIWGKNDALSVFYPETESTALGPNVKFTISEEDIVSNVFKGELPSVMESGKLYDWHAFYPYNSSYGTSKLSEGIIGYSTYGSECENKAIKKAQEQYGYGSMAHLAGKTFPLYGKVTGVTADGSVRLDMKHLMSVLELEVTNNATSEIVVKEIQFSVPGCYLVGSFHYNVKDGTYITSSEDGKYNSDVATLTITNAACLGIGEKATFYLGVIPVTVTSGEMSMTVITDKGSCVKTKTLMEDSPSDDLVFKAGKIKKMSFGYDAEVVVNSVTLPWNEDFSDEDAFADYTITGDLSVAANAFAGGTSPEAFFKNSASMMVNVDVKNTSRTLTLAYKTNKTSLALSVSKGVVLSEKTVSDKSVLYTLTLEDDVEQVTLTWTSSENSRLDDISLVEGVKSLQTLLFKESDSEQAKTVTSLAAVVGSSVTPPVLKGAMTDVTYSSTNTSVATVNSSTGALTVLTAGETEIVATAAETATFFAASARYKLIVSEPVTLTHPLTSNITWTIVKDNSAYGSKVIIGDGEYDAVKLGTSNKTGAFDLIIPSGTKRIGFYAVAWNNASGSIKVTSVLAEGAEPTVLFEQSFVKNEGFKGSSSTYTISASDETDYYEIVIKDIPALGGMEATPSDMTITVSTVSDAQRVLLWGINHYN